MTLQNRPAEGESWDEKALLLTMLNFTHEVALWKVRGLGQDKARFAPFPTTSPLMSAANVLNHLRHAQRSWVDVEVLGTGAIWPEDAADDPDWREGSELPLDEVIRLYEEDAESVRATFADLDLDAPIRGPHPDALTVRWVLLHLIEETARHNGHLDLLREMADGEVGYY